MQLSIFDEVSKLELAVEAATQRLIPFEKKYGVSSDTFMARLSAEDLDGGDDEYIRWVGEYELRQSLLEKIKGKNGFVQKKTGENCTIDPYLTTANGVLFIDDCLKIFPRIRSESVDCVFADPPFNLGKDYNNGFDDSLSQSRYLQWCEQWIAEACRIVKPGGAVFIYATPELAIQFGGILNGHGMMFRHWIAMTMKGTFRRGNKLYPAHYALLYYTRGNPKTFNNLRVPIQICRHCGKEIKDYGGHRNKLNPDGLNLTDFWEDTSPNRHKKYKVRQGVNELKLMIPERAILISTNEGDIVCDPFGGGGSTFQAAQKHNRNWIGIELFDGEHIKQRLTEQFPDTINNSPNFQIEKVFCCHETD